MKSFQLFRRNLQPCLRTLTTATRQQARPSPILNRIAGAARQKPSPFPLRHRQPYSSKPQKPQYNPTPHLNSPSPSLSLSQRLQKLSREYGWSAFGVYLLLTALDFPFCFAAVRYLGTDRIGRYEHVALEWIKSMIPETVVERWKSYRESSVQAKQGNEEGETGSVSVGGLAGEETKVEAFGVVKGEREVGVMPGYDHGVEEAEKLNKSENASKL